MSELPSWERAAGEGDLPGRTSVWGGQRERDRTLSQAWSQVSSDITELGWSALVRRLSDHAPTAIQCALVDEARKDVEQAVGAGKGDHAVAWVGAHFEALEHAVTGPAWADRLDWETATVSELLDQGHGDDRALRMVDDGAVLGCLRYAGLGAAADFLAPAFEWAPWFPSPDRLTWRRALGDTTDYSPVLSYSGSSGCAIGATADEAILHGLNEWIERDAFSLFLLTSIHDEGPMPPGIDPVTLPPPLRDLLACAELEIGSAMALLDITTDNGVPAVLSYVPSSSGASSYGLGASAFPEVAVERAITELVQGALLDWAVRAHRFPDTAPGGEGTTARPGAGYDQLVAEQDRATAIRRRLAPHPRLLACAELRFGHRLPEVRLAPLRPGPVTDTVGDQLRHVAGALADTGSRVGWTPIHRFASGTTVAHVHCTRMERFQMIVHGHLTLPGPRGRRLRANLARD